MKIKSQKWSFALGLLISAVMFQSLALGATPTVDKSVAEPAASATKNSDLFSISPAYNRSSWLVYQIKPGDSIKDVVLVKNLSDNELTLNLYPVDTQEQTGTQQQEGYLLASKDAERKYIGKWLSMESSSVTLKPHSELKVPITLNVPSDTLEKEYRGGVVVEKAAAANASDASSSANTVTIATRVGLRVYATVDKNAVTTKPNTQEVNQAIAPAPVTNNNNNNIVMWVVVGLLVIAVIGFAVKSSKSKKK